MYILILNIISGYKVNFQAVSIVCCPGADAEPAYFIFPVNAEKRNYVRFL